MAPASSAVSTLWERLFASCFRNARPNPLQSSSEGCTGPIDPVYRESIDSLPAYMFLNQLQPVDSFFVDVGSLFRDLDTDDEVHDPFEPPASPREELRRAFAAGERRMCRRGAPWRRLDLQERRVQEHEAHLQALEEILGTALFRRCAPQIEHLPQEAQVGGDCGWWFSDGDSDHGDEEDEKVAWPGREPAPQALRADHAGKSDRGVQKKTEEECGSPYTIRAVYHEDDGASNGDNNGGAEQGAWLGFGALVDPGGKATAAWAAGQPTGTASL
jgi:hypothetical protein